MKTFLLASAAVTLSTAILASPPLSAGGGSAASQGENAAGQALSINGRPTLDPAQFTGDVRKAYEIARENPALLVQLDCYCGCRKSDGHKNLLDCYRDTHGATCDICTLEALEAHRMFKEGSPADQIRAALRDRFGGGG